MTETIVYPPAGYAPTVPYNDLPELPPKIDVETNRTLKHAIGANKSLAELRGMGDLIPNQAVLLRSIVLQEAKLSSEIENIVTTNDKLYQAVSADERNLDPNTKEVLRYGHALWHGYEALKSQGRFLSASLFIELVRVIKLVDLGIRDLPGCQVTSDRTKKAIYTPPDDPQRIRQLLDNLSEFLYAEDGIDPLIKLAVAHYQFEAIHPFSDGNGRTGRVINMLYLIAQDLLELPVLYLSRFIIENKPAYYSGLRRVTEEGAWEDWIVYMLEGIESSATHMRNMIRSIRKTLNSAFEFSHANLGRSYRKEMIELVFAQPYTRIASVEAAGIAKRDAASWHLRELEKIGLLRSIKIGRDKLYINPALMDILTR